MVSSLITYIWIWMALWVDFFLLHCSGVLIILKVHPCTHPEGKAAPETEEEMMVEIFKYTERIVNMIRPRKLLMMAIGKLALSSPYLPGLIQVLQMALPLVQRWTNSGHVGSEHLRKQRKRKKRGRSHWFCGNVSFTCLLYSLDSNIRGSHGSNCDGRNAK